MEIPDLIAELRDAHQITFTGEVTQQMVCEALKRPHSARANKLLADLLRHQFVQQRCGGDAVPTQQQ